jgi:hypothetical protein
MELIDGIGSMHRTIFNALFSADWLCGTHALSALLPRRWERLHERMLQRASRGAEGRTFVVDRRTDLTPAEFREQYFLPGRPVVLEGGAAHWPAIAKWTPDYLNSFCGNDRVGVLDGQNWTVNRENAREAVSTAENTLNVRDLIGQVKNGGPWYGAFMELLDKHPQLRQDLDLTFVERFGHTNRHLPWHRNIMAKMYLGAAGTGTSLHCAAVSNLFVQIRGEKKWVLIAPEFTPFMYPAPTRGLNWQSRVDFRNPDLNACPLYRFVDRHETVLQPGDILWNPPFVWHGVQNTTESIAVSLWWINLTRGFRNSLLLSALTMCGTPNPLAMQLGLKRAKRTGSSHFGVHLNR